MYAERSGQADPHAQPAKLASETEPGTELALSAVPQEPFHGTRGTTPGPGGCWALTSTRHQPCRAAAIRGRDYCSAHSGLGVARNPAEFSPRGIAASAQSRRAKAELRLALGVTRPGSARSALRAVATQNAVRLAGRAVSAALDPQAEPLKAADLALRIIDQADPQGQNSISVSGSFDPSTASWSQLLSFAESQGMELGALGNGSVEPSPPSE